MRKMFLIAAAMLLLITGCGKNTDITPVPKAEYTYNAHCGEYDLVFTPSTLTVTFAGEEISQPVTVDIPSRTVQFENQKIQTDVLFSQHSIFIFGELLYNILSDAIPTRADTQKDKIILQGTYIEPFTLTLDGKTAVPLELTYNGRTVYFI